MTKTNAETTEEFFKRRFPDKDIKFEKECGYFGEWEGRFATGNPEMFMDAESKVVWKQMQEDDKERFEQLTDEYHEGERTDVEEDVE